MLFDAYRGVFLKEIIDFPIHPGKVTQLEHGFLISSEYSKEVYLVDLDFAAYRIVFYANEIVVYSKMLRDGNFALGCEKSIQVVSREWDKIKHVPSKKATHLIQLRNGWIAVLSVYKHITVYDEQLNTILFEFKVNNSCKIVEMQDGMLYAYGFDSVGTINLSTQETTKEDSKWEDVLKLSNGTHLVLESNGSTRIIGEELKANVCVFDGEEIFVVPELTVSGGQEVVEIQPNVVVFRTNCDVIQYNVNRRAIEAQYRYRFEREFLPRIVFE